MHILSRTVKSREFIFTCIGSSAHFLSKYWCLYCGGQDGQKVTVTVVAMQRHETLNHIFKKKKEKKVKVRLSSLHARLYVYLFSDFCGT